MSDSPDALDVASAVATWLSFGVTIVGLTGLISQASAINDKMDPFHATRSKEYLGIWFQRQDAFPWWKIAKPPPTGPVIKANLDVGFCGLHELYAVRMPLNPALAGTASWAVILSILRSDIPPPRYGNSGDEAEKAAALQEGLNQSGSTSIRDGEAGNEVARLQDEMAAGWTFLEQTALDRYKESACVRITRTTLILMLLLTNGRKVFQYSDAAGFRAGYASYNGQWYMTWPIGQEAVAKFAPHDSHHDPSKDVYPRCFLRRVSRVVEVACGIVHGRASGLQVAFSGRKPPGSYRLEHQIKGFPGAHGSRHLYAMMGGRAYDVDFLFARAETEKQEGGAEESDDDESSELVLDLPSTEKERRVKLIFPIAEQRVIEGALDCLPWNTMAWSIHRGMRDILVTFAKPVMDAHRRELADLLKKTCVEKPFLLDSCGWNPAFVRQSMGDMAASAVMLPEGNSGDLVRVVTGIVQALAGDWKISQLDEVNFWRKPKDQREGPLDLQGVVALTKLFVLEWSNEFDYQVYHDMPINWYFG